MRAHISAVHPVLMARDVATSLRFYVELGFHIVFQDRIRTPRYAAVARDECELHLQWQDSTQWDQPVDRPTYRFLVNDPDLLYRELRDSGMVSAEGPTPGSPWSSPGNTPWGTREFHLRDPAGNGLQFYAPLPDP